MLVKVMAPRPSSAMAVWAPARMRSSRSSSRGVGSGRGWRFSTVARTMRAGAVMAGIVVL